MLRILILYMFELIRHTFHIWDIHRPQRLFLQMTATLEIINRASEALGITGDSEIMSQAPNFIKQILSFLAYGGSSIVKTMN
jgi:hypothetical protein